MEMLLRALRGFFRRVHLSGLNQGQLTVMVALADREQTCMEIVTQTGYDRSAVRQILQRLRVMLFCGLTGLPVMVRWNIFIL